LDGPVTARGLHVGLAFQGALDVVDVEVLDLGLPGTAFELMGQRELGAVGLEPDAPLTALGGDDGAAVGVLELSKTGFIALFDVPHKGAHAMLPQGAPLLRGEGGEHGYDYVVNGPPQFIVVVIRHLRGNVVVFVHEAQGAEAVECDTFSELGQLAEPLGGVVYGEPVFAPVVQGLGLVAGEDV
jgi:hypothetical protein